MFLRRVRTQTSPQHGLRMLNSVQCVISIHLSTWPADKLDRIAHDLYMLTMRVSVYWPCSAVRDIDMPDLIVFPGIRALFVKMIECVNLVDRTQRSWSRHVDNSDEIHECGHISTDGLADVWNEKRGQWGGTSTQRLKETPGWLVVLGTCTVPTIIMINIIFINIIIMIILNILILPIWITGRILLIYLQKEQNCSQKNYDQN